MTRLGYSQRELKHLYLSEFINKYRVYKTLFNFEKLGAYELEFKKASLRDL